MLCTECNKGELVATTQSSAVSIAGLLSVLIVIAGLVALMANPLLGVLAIILGVLVGTLGRPRKTVLVCPHCHANTPL